MLDAMELNLTWHKQTALAVKDRISVFGVLQNTCLFLPEEVIVQIEQVNFVSNLDTCKTKRILQLKQQGEEEEDPIIVAVPYMTLNFLFS